MADPKTYTEEEFNAVTAERDRVNKKNAELLSEKKKLGESLKVFDGIDPDDVKAMRERLEDVEKTRAKAEGDYTALEKRLTEKHAKDLEGRDGRIGKLSKAVDLHVKQAALTAAIVKAGGDADLLLPHAERAAKVVETEEGFTLALTDEKGQTVEPDAFVTQTLKVRFPGAFQGTGSSGGGASRSSHAGGAGSVRQIPAGATWSKQDIEDIASGKAVALM